VDNLFWERVAFIMWRGGRLEAQQRPSLSTRHPDGAPVAVEENAAAVIKLLFGRLIAKGRKVIVCLLVGEEEDQAQELAMMMMPFNCSYRNKNEDGYGPR
jgi:hypothetical protein